MFNNKKVILSIVIAIVVIAGLVFGFMKKNANPSTSASPSTSLGVTASPSPSNSSLGKPSGKDLNSLTPEEIEKLVNGGPSGTMPTNVPYSQLTVPATCQASGNIEFFSQGNASDNAKLTYTGIDSPARQIKWHVSPDDNLQVGPNLASSLDLPDGSHMVTVVLPSAPKSKSYNLTVSMTYGRYENGGVVVHEVNCSGQVSVKLSY